MTQFAGPSLIHAPVSADSGLPLTRDHVWPPTLDPVHAIASDPYPTGVSP